MLTCNILAQSHCLHPSKLHISIYIVCTYTHTCTHRCIYVLCTMWGSIAIISLCLHNDNETLCSHTQTTNRLPRYWVMNTGNSPAIWNVTIKIHNSRNKLTAPAPERGRRSRQVWKSRTRLDWRYWVAICHLLPPGFLNHTFLYFMVAYLVPAEQLCVS